MCSNCGSFLFRVVFQTDAIRRLNETVISTVFFANRLPLFHRPPKLNTSRMKSPKMTLLLLPPPPPSLPLLLLLQRFFCSLSRSLYTNLFRFLLFLVFMCVSSYDVVILKISRSHTRTCCCRACSSTQSQPIRLSFTEQSLSNFIINWFVMCGCVCVCASACVCVVVGPLNLS